MVSLEDRADYSMRITKSPKLTAFNNLLLRKTILTSPIQGLNESDEVYFGLVEAIHTKNKTAFENYYNKKNKSHPSKESPSPFVNDDFLIFCLIVGIVNFGLDKSWIKNILAIRSRSAITITLENILNENYYSKSNLYEIVLMYFQLTNLALITNDFLNNAYKSIVENTALFESKSDFQILCSIRAYDIIIELKESPDGSEVNLLKEFNSSFLKRIKLLSWIIQTTFLVGLLYVLIQLISFNPIVKEFFDRIGSVLKILGLFGISQLGNVFPIVKRNTYGTLLRIFGYPKALIDELHK